MTMGFFKNQRGSIYPEITDWASENNHLRHDRHKRLADLVFFSPFMYKFIRLGLYVYFMVVIIVIDYFVKGGFLQVIVWGLYIYNMYRGTKEYNALQGNDINLYDILLRDWKNGSVKQGHSKHTKKE